MANSFSIGVCVRRAGYCAIGACVVVLGACTNGTLDPDKLATNAIEALPAAPIAVLSGNRVPTGTPTEIYERIARGFHSCWLGGPGGLRKTHKFHAVAVPLAEGGQSKIIIFQRPTKEASDKENKAGEKRKGSQAFRVLISPQGVSALVEAQNIKFPKEIGDKMVDDTHRWAAGEVGCIEGGVKEGWEAQTQEVKAKGKGGKKK